MSDESLAEILRLAAEAASASDGETVDVEELSEIARAVSRGEVPRARTAGGESFARLCLAYLSGWEDLSRIVDEEFEGWERGLRAAATVLLVDSAPRAGGEALRSALRWLDRVEPDLRVAAVKVLGALAEGGEEAALDKLLEVLRTGREVRRVRLAALGSLWGIAASRGDLRDRVTSELASLLPRERDPEVRLGIVSALLSLLKRGDR